MPKNPEEPTTNLASISAQFVSDWFSLAPKYRNKEQLRSMVEQAILWALEYELEG